MIALRRQSPQESTMADLWSTKHEEALQRLYSTLCEAVGEVDTRIQFEEALKRLGWPLEPPGLMDPPGLAVQKTFTSLLRAKIMRKATRRAGLRKKEGA
jgi:hypothetical protein